MVVINAHNTALAHPSHMAISSRLQTILEEGGLSFGAVRIAIVEADSVMLERDEGAVSEFGTNACLVHIQTPKGEQPYICIVTPTFGIEDGGVEETLNAYSNQRKTTKGEQNVRGRKILSWTHLTSDEDLFVRALLALQSEQEKPCAERRLPSDILKDALRLEMAKTQIGVLVRKMTQHGWIEKIAEFSNKFGRVSEFGLTNQSIEFIREVSSRSEQESVG